MMTENRKRNLRCRRTMRKGGGSQCRLSKRSAICKDLALVIESEFIASGQFHEQLVRMLAVHNRQAVCRFPGLEELRISFSSHGCRLQTQHRAKSDRAPADLLHHHRHGPVHRKKLVLSSGAALLNINDKSV